MAHTSTEPELDAVLRDARWRTALVFRVNILLSLVIAFILIGAMTTGIIIGFLGNHVSATALGGVALLDLIGAAVYRPLAQVNRAYVKAQRIDMLTVSARDRLRAADAIQDPGERMTASKIAWSSILDDLDAVQRQ